MRAKYRSICVKFREDDPKQLAAWEYLQKRVSVRCSYGVIIAELIAAGPGDSGIVPGEPLKQIEERLRRLEHICMETKEQVQMRDFPPAGMPAVGGSKGAGVEETQNEAQLNAGVASFVLSMGDEDEE